ncbi:MAG: tetraacyldisaccharide 4'-kinase [bacterium]|nr:tetraacyldisaccharide 4'-kinase [bacterium]
MHIKGNSRSTKLKIFCLDTISIAFKTISLLNLIRKSLHCKKYPALIISIDNLSFGGTGKTTLVNEIGKAFEEHGLTFAIVTRGYKSKFENSNTKVLPHHSVEEVGDEAKIFKTRFPNRDIYIGKNRETSVQHALRDNNKIILLDDGFQTTNLVKDLRIMLLNPNHPYYYLRNFKYLRKKETYVLYYQNKKNGKTTGTTAQKNNTSRDPANKNRPITGNYYFETDGAYDTGGKRIEIGDSSLLGFSALGDNERFKNDLSIFKLAGFKGFKDHHPFSEDDLQGLNHQRIRTGADYLICSEKDFIKLKSLNLKNIPLIFLKNSIKFSINLLKDLYKHAKREN